MTALRALGVDLERGDLIARLRGCFEACQSGGYVGHIGVMLARPTPWLRVNLKNIRVEAVSAVLNLVGWRGDFRELGTWLPALASFTDGITVCLDVGSEISPRLGLECAVQERPGWENRSAAFLGKLIAKGLCTPEKSAALLAWPGCTDPRDLPGPWPRELARLALLQSPGYFTAIHRDISHVKVTLAPGREPEAKVYFGFNHVWLKPVLETRTEGPLPAAWNSKCGAAEVAGAIKKATEFLLDARSFTGWWLEYDGFESGGTSDEWVTGYIGTALAGLPDESCRRAVAWAWELLAERRQGDEGWGFNSAVPPDADSTIWALEVARAAGRSEADRARGAAAFLVRHGEPDGIHTYREEYFLPHSGHVAVPPDIKSWFGQHTCVTAAAAANDSLGMRAELLPRLRDLQAADGRWQSAWWPDDDYATAHGAEALAEGGVIEDRARLERAARWAAKRVRSDGAVPGAYHPDGSAFCAAFVLRTLLLVENSEDIRETLTRVVRWLLKQQRTDGSWAPSAGVYVKRSDPPVTETRGAFTTATVLMALRVLQAKINSGAVHFA